MLNTSGAATERNGLQIPVLMTWVEYKKHKKPLWTCSCKMPFNIPL
jgi:hypothetical protein